MSMERGISKGVQYMFTMERFCKEPKLTYILQRLNDVRLYLQVSRPSDITNEAGISGGFRVKIAKRRELLEENMKLWKDTMRTYFYGI